MAQVVSHDPSASAPAEPQIITDDAPFAQPLVPDRIPPYNTLRTETLPYSAQHLIDRSRAPQHLSHTMRATVTPKDPAESASRADTDFDHPTASAPIQTATAQPAEPEATLPTTDVAKNASPADNPRTRNEIAPKTAASYRDVLQPPGNYTREAAASEADQSGKRSARTSTEDDTVQQLASEKGPSADDGHPELQQAESGDEPAPSHGGAHVDSVHPDSIHEMPQQSVPLDHVQHNPGVFNMMSSFADMSLNPMQYGPSVQMVPIPPHPAMSLSPQHAAQVAHQQRQQQIMQQHRQPFCLWVPQERVGAVIGGHGAVIRSLQDRSGAAIQVHNDTVQGDHKLFTIFGTLSQYETAAQLVREIVERPRPSSHGGSSVSSERPHYSTLGDHMPRTTEMYKTVYVPTSCVGLVIGRNGETIRNLQDRSGADIKVTPDEEATPGAENRSILISGTEDAISQAHQLVSEIVMEARSRRPPHSSPQVGGSLNGQPVIVEMLAVPNDKVGLIIGKKGATIRELQQRSGAKIQVTKDDSCVQSDGSRPVTITGIRANVDEAKVLIANKINVPILPSTPASSGNTSGVPGASSMPPQALPAHGMPYVFAPQVYEPEFQNGHPPYHQVLESSDPSAQNRAAMTYFPYLGYNNFPAMTQHARHFQPPVAMQYGPQQHGLQEQQGMQTPHPEQQDSSAQSPFPSPTVPQGQPIEVPTSPTLLSRDANGNVVVYPGHPFPQLPHQLPPQHQLFPPAPTSRMFPHREQAQAAQAQAQAQMMAHAAHAQAQAHAQAAHAQGQAHLQAQVQAQVEAQAEAETGIQTPPQPETSVNVNVASAAGDQASE